METIKVKIVNISSGNENIPDYMTERSSGADLKANITEPIVIEPHSTVLIPTGIKMEIPSGFEGQIRPRSGLALKHGISVLNTPGTIDSDYRGEIKIILHNFSNKPYIIQPYERIAQIVFAPVVKANFDITNEINETKRNEGGFGHTGI